MPNFGTLFNQKDFGAREIFFAKKQIDCKGSRQKNRRISASYSILKILAHAQYYPICQISARFIFTGFFFANKQSDCKDGYSSSGKQDGNWQRSVVQKKNAIFSSNLLSGCSTYYVACFATALPDTMEPNFGQKSQMSFVQ